MERIFKKISIAVCVLCTLFASPALIVRFLKKVGFAELHSFSSALSTQPVTITQTQTESKNTFVIVEEPKTLPESNLKTLTVAAKHNHGETIIVFADSSFVGKIGEPVKIQIIKYPSSNIINGKKNSQEQYSFLYIVKK